MPLIEKIVSLDRARGLWRIDEDEGSLSRNHNINESIPEKLVHPNKRLEFVAGRALVGQLLQAMNLNFHGITKNEHGKPFLKNYTYHLSLSHSYPYVTALIDKKKSVGIDLEQIKSKLLAIAPRVLHPDERRDAGENLTKHCIYWCAKEAMIKIHGEKDLVFAEHLLLLPFQLENEGELIGRIIVGSEETMVPLYYQVTKDFVIVYNT